jgi:hypothetical protein
MRRRTSRPRLRHQAASFEARITRHPILTFLPKPEVEFLFESKKLKGYAGEPIAAALVANGVKVFRVTEKMHRPRSFFCAVGKCSSCLMEVDGRPNVMVCMEPLKAGMRVRRQTGRGELGQDSPQRHDGHNGTNTEAIGSRGRPVAEPDRTVEDKPNKTHHNDTTATTVLTRKPSLPEEVRVEALSGQSMVVRREQLHSAACRD